MHFDLDKKTSHAYDDIEYMRILAERERIHNFKTVASESAYVYYKILKRITEDGLKKLTEKTQTQQQNNDPQVRIQASLKDTSIKQILSFITDYMRQVIENGQKFESKHLYLMLVQFNH